MPEIDFNWLTDPADHVPASAGVEENAQTVDCPNRKAHLAFHLLIDRHPELAEGERPCVWVERIRYPREGCTMNPNLQSTNAPAREP